MPKGIRPQLDLFDGDERALRALLDAYSGAIDVARLHRVLADAVTHHPDRDVIEAMLADGAHLFARPATRDDDGTPWSLPDDVIVSVGYFRDARLNPPGAPAGVTRVMGRVALFHVLRRPAPAEASSN